MDYLIFNLSQKIISVKDKSNKLTLTSCNNIFDQNFINSVNSKMIPYLNSYYINTQYLTGTLNDLNVSGISTSGTETYNQNVFRVIIKYQIIVKKINNLFNFSVINSYLSNCLSNEDFANLTKNVSIPVSFSYNSNIIIFADVPTSFESYQVTPKTVIPAVPDIPYSCCETKECHCKKDIFNNPWCELCTTCKTCHTGKAEIVTPEILVPLESGKINPNPTIDININEASLTGILNCTLSLIPPNGTIIPLNTSDQGNTALYIYNITSNNLIFTTKNYTFTLRLQLPYISNPQITIDMNSIDSQISTILNSTSITFNSYLYYVNL